MMNWSNIYFTSLIIAAIAGAISIVSGFIQHKTSEKSFNKMQENVAVAKDSAAKTELHSIELQKENIQLNLMLEKEKLARLEIERRLAPRFLTQTEEKIIFNSIKEFSGHHISITKLGEAEAGRYAGQIIHIIRSAGWEVTENYTGVMSPPPYNVICIVPAQPDKAIISLVSSLKKAGVNIIAQVNHKAPSHVINILIGLKLQE